MRGAKLGGCTLEYATFKGVDLRQADLSEAAAKGAKFPESNLEQANLKGAKLRYSTFTKANLQKAIFVECDLRESMLDWVKAQGAAFRKAKLDYADLAQRTLVASAPPSVMTRRCCPAARACSAEADSSSPQSRWPRSPR